MATAAFLRPEEEKLFEGQPKVDLSMLIDFRKLAVLKLGLPFDSPVAQVPLPDQSCDITLLPQGFPFGDFHLEDVMLPEDDDLGISSEDDENLEEEVRTETGFGCVVGEWTLILPFAPDILNGSHCSQLL